MIVDGQWRRLESRYWSDKLGQMATLGARVRLARVGATLRNLGGPLALASRIQRKDMQVMERWQFNRIGSGCWLIRNGGATLGAAALDVDNNPAKSYPLALTDTEGDSPRLSGQYRRCGVTRRPGAIRPFNYFLSEARSIDTFGNLAEPIMSETGNFAAQVWIVHPAPAPEYEPSSICGGE